MTITTDEKDYKCNSNFIGDKCDIACTWANLGTVPDGAAARKLTSCGACKAKFFGKSCEKDCSGATFSGAGIDAQNRCLCKTGTWYDGQETATCAKTCGVIDNSKVNAGTTACECNTDYVGDATLKCI